MKSIQLSALSVPGHAFTGPNGHTRLGDYLGNTGISVEPSGDGEVRVYRVSNHNDARTELPLNAVKQVIAARTKALHQAEKAARVRTHEKPTDQDQQALDSKKQSLDSKLRDCDLTQLAANYNPKSQDQVKKLLEVIRDTAALEITTKPNSSAADLLREINMIESKFNRAIELVNKYWIQADSVLKDAEGGFFMDPYYHDASRLETAVRASAGLVLSMGPVKGIVKELESLLSTRSNAVKSALSHFAKDMNENLMASEKLVSSIGEIRTLKDDGDNLIATLSVKLNKDRIKEFIGHQLIEQVGPRLKKGQLLLSGRTISKRGPQVAEQAADQQVADVSMKLAKHMIAIAFTFLRRRGEELKSIMDKLEGLYLGIEAKDTDDSKQRWLSLADSYSLRSDLFFQSPSVYCMTVDVLEVLKELNFPPEIIAMEEEFSQRVLQALTQPK